MNTYQVQFKQAVRIEDIEAALSLVGEFKLTAKRLPVAKAEREYQQPLAVYRNGAQIREIDPIEVERGMRKFQSMCDARLRVDGRHKNDFPQFNERLGARDYITRFCNNLHHTSKEYDYSAVSVPQETETV